MPSDSPKAPEITREVGYQHSWPCPYCYIGTHIRRFHDHFNPPPLEPPTTFTKDEKEAFTEAQKKADKDYWAPRYRVRRWALFLAGTSIMVLTAMYVKRVYGWAHRRGGVVVEKYHVGEEWVDGGWWTVRKDGMLRLALLLVMNAPCACFAGFLISTGYYWKDKRNQKAAKRIERAKQELKDSANATLTADYPNPKLIDVRYEDLPQHQKFEVVIGSSGIDVPAEARLRKGKEEGWAENMASWWSGATAVSKSRYDRRYIKKRN